MKEYPLFQNRSWVKSIAKAVRPPGKIFLVMKFTAVIILANCLQVSAKGDAQLVSISVKDAPLEQVFTAIRKQTDYLFFYKSEYIVNAKPVTLDVKNKPVEEVLKLCLAGQGFGFAIKGRTIYIVPVNGNKLVSSNVTVSPQQELPVSLVDTIDVRGKVVDEDGNPLEGISVFIRGSSRGTTTNAVGEFKISGVNENAVLMFSGVSFETLEIRVNKRTDLAPIRLAREINELELATVVNTGYQKLKPNEVTGSIVQINNAQFNRVVSTDVLSRLQGTTSGVLFKLGLENPIISDSRNNVLIRGFSTILGPKQPLIVLDNFPFEGDINSINPNDVESVSILKDAAAASIWGTKAGNGVIIITTKKGKYNQKTEISFNTSLSIINKPDIFYPQTLSSSDFIDVETFLFDKGFYNSAINSKTRPALSPAVEILLKRRSGQISAADSAQMLGDLRKMEVRDDLLKYYFEKPINQQYALNIAGGSNKHNFFVSFGYNYNLNSVSTYKRTSMIASNTFLLANSKIEITSSLWLSNTITKDFASQYAFSYPYGQLAEENGTPLPVAIYRQEYIDTAGAGKLLDWTYYPLKEREYADNKRNDFNYRISSNIKYKIAKGINGELKFAYEKDQVDTDEHFSPQTFYTRDLINTFSSIDWATGIVTRPIPLGGILNKGNATYTSKNLRGQLSYDKTWDLKHQFNSIIGAELGMRDVKSNTFIYYGYDKENGTSIPVDFVNKYKTYISEGALNIPSNQSFSKLSDRSVSIFANGSYTYKTRYRLYFSLRRDGSNIFGANTNNKWKPLWAIGASWDLEKESFCKINWLPQLKIRVTYGYQGNIANTIPAVLTIYSGTPNRWNLPSAVIDFQPNPDLKWEEIRTFNAALDFRIGNDRISGSIEYFLKNGTDLIGNQMFPPSSGFSNYKANSANIRGQGFDISLRTTNLKGRQFKWTTTLLFSYANTIVTDYKLSLTNISAYVNGSENPIVNRPVQALYSYRWGGLDPLTGDPQGYVNGQVSKNYTSILASTDFDNLVYSGPSTAPYFGSILNEISWRNFSISINIIYKLGYFFRKNSINYYNLFNGLDKGHVDYRNRWMDKGDEVNTHVPSLIYPAISNRDIYYSDAEILIEKGDHVRVQDIRISYDLNKAQFKRLPFSSLKMYVYISNIGIIWKANKVGIDPDYNPLQNYTYGLPGRSIAAGLTLNF